MSWFKNLFRKNFHEVIPQNIKFLYEQDGEPEREVKEVLIKLFTTRANVLRAYLARLDYGKPEEYNVALCLVTSDGEDMNLTAAISKVHQDFAAKGAQLDILFSRF